MRLAMDGLVSAFTILGNGLVLAYLTARGANVFGIPSAN
jgi:hypothetical protein